MSAPRFYVPPGQATLREGAALVLPPGTTRHIQVLRLQPGRQITLFDGAGGEWGATIARMGRSDVQAEVGGHRAVEREAARTVHLAVGLMAATRMDWLLEKATELGAASLTPILMARSGQRLTGERARRKHEHWQAVVVAASQQCGRNRLLEVQLPLGLADWLLTQQAAVGPAARWLLSPDALASGLRSAGRDVDADAPVTLLSGPEGGLDPSEEQAARDAGFQPINLGPRVLRAETAPLAALAALLSP